MVNGIAAILLSANLLILACFWVIPEGITTWTALFLFFRKSAQKENLKKKNTEKEK